MDRQYSDQLVKGVREMKRYMAGKGVYGAKTTKLPAPSAVTSRNGSAPPGPSRTRPKNGV